MFKYVKTMLNAFEQAAQLSRIAKEYSDPDERREAMLAVIHVNQLKQVQRHDRRVKDRQHLAA